MRQAKQSIDGVGGEAASVIHGARSGRFVPAMGGSVANDLRDNSTLFAAFCREFVALPEIFFTQSGPVYRAEIPGSRFRGQRAQLESGNGIGGVGAAWAESAGIKAVGYERGDACRRALGPMLRGAGDGVLRRGTETRDFRFFTFFTYCGSFDYFGS